MRYAGIKENDIINGEGVCVSFFVQGCPHRCKGCFNPETWDFNGGKQKSLPELINEIIELIEKNNVQRNFSILGGEPLCPENIKDVSTIISAIKVFCPQSKIFLWTGYKIEDINNSIYWRIIKSAVDYIIDGPFIEKEKDLTLKWRGSRNQRILTKEKIYNIIIDNQKEKIYE